MLLTTVIGFYFSGRMQTKSQDFVINEDRLGKFAQSVKEYRANKTPEEAAIQDAQSSDNRVLAAYRRETRGPKL